VTRDCCNNAALFEKLKQLAKRTGVSKYHEQWRVEIICEPGMSFEEAIQDAPMPQEEKGDL
jgi:superfamily II helicase